MSKPICFSYKDYTDLREAYRQLLEDNQALMADNRKLRKEVGRHLDKANELLMENTDLKILLFRAYLIIKAEVNNDVIANN